MCPILLFDLDGTLTDSKEGILNCIRYALGKMGRPVPAEPVLLKFIGPPLQDSFERYCSMTSEEALQAVTLFRERYAPIGKFENAPAPGMPELCRQLHEMGCSMAVASSKPEEMCIPICQKFGYYDSFPVIVGSPPEADWEKAEIIREALRRLKVSDADLGRVLMVGDRKYDVEGAAKCGVRCIGVEFFGYAAPGELKQAGAAAVVQTAEQLKDCIFSLCR